MRALRYVLGGVVCGAAVARLLSCGGSSNTPIEATPDGAAPPIEDAGPVVQPDGAPIPEVDAGPCRGLRLPSDQVYVPKGMCAGVVASGLGVLRQITFAPNGDLFGVTTSGTVYLLRDEDGDGAYAESEVHEYADASANGNNVHVDAAGGFVYAGTPTGVMRWPYDPAALKAPKGEDVVVGQPAGGHTFHTTHVYDGYLYVHSGSAGNATDPMSPAYDTERSLLKRFPLASFTPGTPFQWSAGEVVTVGLRNMVGFTKNAAGRMYGVVNGLDSITYKGVDVHNDNPGEQVLELGMGKQYGYPFCFTAQRVVDNGTVIAPGTQLYNEGFGVHDDAWCATSSSPPATFVQAHSAPLDIVFFDVQPKGSLPERFRGGAFIALHGSWDRSPATGYKVIWMPFDASGKAPMPTSTSTDTTFPYETVFGGGDANGPKDGPWTWSVDGGSDKVRPVGVAVSPIDGALYVSTDSGGNVYRVAITN